MVKSACYDASNYSEVAIDNAFCVVKTRMSDGQTRHNIYDYSKGEVVCDEWFLRVGKPITFEKREMSGSKHYFQHNYERYNTRMFETDNSTYYAIVNTNLRVELGRGEIATAKNILVFNHDSSYYLFKDCVIGNNFIIRIEHSGVHGVVFISLNDGTQIEYNLIKGVKKVIK